MKSILYCLAIGNQPIKVGNKLIEIFDFDRFDADALKCVVTRAQEEMSGPVVEYGVDVFQYPFNFNVANAVTNE